MQILADFDVVRQTRNQWILVAIQVTRRWNEAAIFFNVSVDEEPFNLRFCIDIVLAKLFFDLVQCP